jgi:protein-tyrosine-phosphatase
MLRWAGHGGTIMNQFRGPIRSVLFVCTGNIFRSLAPEHALKVLLGPHVTCLVSSAGIDAKPQAVHEWVKARLHAKGADPSLHIQRQLTREMVQDADLVIAMGQIHQEFIRDRFRCDAPLFNQVCFGRDESILDVHEALPTWEEDHDRARAYVWSVIDGIWEATPLLIRRLPSFR